MTVIRVYITFFFKTDVNQIRLPQGFTLGPLLFLLYINDLNSALNKAITIHFANDTHLIYASKNLKKIESVIKYEFKKLAD